RSAAEIRHAHDRPAGGRILLHRVDRDDVVVLELTEDVGFGAAALARNLDGDEAIAEVLLPGQKDAGKGAAAQLADHGVAAEALTDLRPPGRIADRDEVRVFLYVKLKRQHPA